MQRFIVGTNPTTLTGPPNWDDFNTAGFSLVQPPIGGSITSLPDVLRIRSFRFQLIATVADLEIALAIVLHGTVTNTFVLKTVLKADLNSTLLPTFILDSDGVVLAVGNVPLLPIRIFAFGPLGAIVTPYLVAEVSNTP